MTIQELQNQYNLHDSCIKRIDYSEDEKILVFQIDFCNWDQEWYKEGDPEFVELSLTFKGIEEYNGPVGDIDYYSIGNDEVIDGKYFMFIQDDIRDNYYEIYLNPSDVIVEMGNAVEE